MSYLVMYGAGLNWKERLFIAFAWSPKVHFTAAILMHTIICTNHCVLTRFYICDHMYILSHAGLLP